MVAQSTARINVAHGSVRSGKSVGLEFFRWVEYCIRGPEGDLLMAGKTLKTLERNVLRPMKQLWGSRWVDYSLGKKEAQIFGRRVELEGGNNERAQDKIQGMTLAGAVINEASLVPESFWNQILGRMSVRGAKLFATTNPDSPYHWLKTKYLDREDELDLRQWHFRIDDNTFLDPAYVKALKAEYTGLWYKRFILGLWVLAAGAVYEMYDEDEHVGTSPNGDPDYHLVGIDYGTSNPCVYLDIEVYLTGGEPCVHIARERYYDGRKNRQKTDSQHAEDLKAFVDPIQRKCYTYLDPSAASFALASKVRTKEADNSVLDGIRFVASMLGSGLLTVDPRCTNVRREFASYVWDEKAQKRGEDKPAKKHDHALDALRYALFTHLGGETWTPGVASHHF